MNPDDQKEALNAILEIYGLDKGPDEQEWVDWCNRHLAFVQRQGHLREVVEFS